MPIFYRDISNEAKGFKDNEDSVQQGLINLMSTLKGERVNKPWFGCDLDDSLFELVDLETAAIIQQRLWECLVQETRINILNIQVTPDEEHGLYNVSLGYTIKGSEDKKFEIQGQLKKSR